MERTLADDLAGLFQRLQNWQNAEILPRICGLFLSVLVAKRGAEAAISTMTTIQAGIHEMILSNIFAVESLKVAKEEKKLDLPRLALIFMRNRFVKHERSMLERRVRCVGEVRGRVRFPRPRRKAPNGTSNAASNHLADDIDLAGRAFGKDRAARGLFRHLFSTLRRETRR